MRMFLAALALGVVIVSPALAASDVSQKKVQVTKKAKQASPVRIQKPRAFSPYVHHPSYDVYVNGQYAGSDPDPRVRWSIRREWCEDAIDGC